jgi:CRISPR-associated protein Cmr6
MKFTNISWLFYKDYFANLDFSETDTGIEKNKSLIRANNKKITGAPLKVIDNALAKQKIQVVVQYPGLATGIGINHEASIEGEFKLGMHFDYTYGMPVVYGSSVKGLLRSAFPDNGNFREQKVESIRAYLGTGFEDLDVDQLRDSIFDGKENGISLSVYQRDVFFDAVIVSANSKGKIVDSDSITPHKEALKNPIPITFLKIASGVSLEFRFDLKDSTVGGVKVSAELKRNLFKSILLDFGIGAKTNVGYGQFRDEKR